MTWIYDDGGRAAAGFRGHTGDCVTRAVAIATGLPYRDVYAEFANGNASSGQARSARRGVSKKIYGETLSRLGWKWTATMGIGTGCKVHVRADELPSGVLILRLSRHVAAFIDGVLHDTYDSSRDGTRCVYGYWSAGVKETVS